MQERIKRIIQSTTASAGAGAVPATYIHMFDSLDLYMKLGGFGVLSLQGIYLMAKIRNEWNKNK